MRSKADCYADYEPEQYIMERVPSVYVPIDYIESAKFLSHAVLNINKTMRHRGDPTAPLVTARYSEEGLQSRRYASEQQ